MEWDELFEELKVILGAEWELTPVAYQNEGFQAPQDAPWVYLELLPVDGFTTLFGSPGLRIQSDIGIIAFHVFTPTGTGAGTAFRLARQIGKLLELRTIAPGVETEGRALGGAASSDDEGNWFRVSASVPVSIHSTT